MALELMEVVNDASKLTLGKSLTILSFILSSAYVMEILGQTRWLDLATSLIGAIMVYMMRKENKKK